MTKKFVVEVEQLDKKGSGEAILWPVNERGFKRKLRLIIPEAIPGEKVEVLAEKPELKWSKAEITEIIEESPDRTTPPCPHFSLCGGCVWQHWTYEGQLQEKFRYVKKQLSDQGFDTDLVQEPIGAEQPWHYRNKMEFTFAADGSMGLHEQGNFRKIIPLETCLIAGNEMFTAAMEIAKWVKDHNLTGYHKETKEGLFRHLMVRQSFATGEIMLALFATETHANYKEAIEDLKERIHTLHPKVKSLIWLKNTLWADRAQAESVDVLLGRDFIYDELAGFRYRLWYDTFFQTNPKQAEKLVEIALQMGNPQKHEKMIDLFCGVGTFSLPFASRTGALAGVEIVETSIESAKRNAKDNDVDDTYFLAADARRGIDVVLEKFGTPDLLLLDPPRSGAGGKVMRRIGRAQPERIVYVSCNPETFAKDITELVPFGYELKKVQPVDLFPHTVHIELVALLDKIN